MDKIEIHSVLLLAVRFGSLATVPWYK